jgi:hypothetical protein
MQTLGGRLVEPLAANRCGEHSDCVVGAARFHPGSICKVIWR